jgi:hypothetical protein
MLIPEIPSFRDVSRDASKQGNMVGSAPGDRGQRGRGKTFIPGVVNKHPIETNKVGRGAAIGPGEPTVAQRKLNEP